MTADVLRSGFCSIVGRPNVGKSTLLNALVGESVAITTPVPQTTRHAVRGILHDDGVQVVFVDTPGLHKPRTLLGRRLNDVAREAVADVDVLLFVVDEFETMRMNLFTPESGAWPPPDGTILIERIAAGVIGAAEGSTITVSVPPPRRPFRRPAGLRRSGRDRRQRSAPGSCPWRSAPPWSHPPPDRL